MKTNETVVLNKNYGRILIYSKLIVDMIAERYNPTNEEIELLHNTLLDCDVKLLENLYKNFSEKDVNIAVFGLSVA